MTQQHCGHECCPIEKRRAGKGDDGVIRCYPLEPCPHDTRRAPAPAAPDETKAPLIRRVWAMPNKNTFQIPPIKDLINSFNIDWIDPFPDPYRKDAMEYLATFKSESVLGVLFDPPYSPRQLKECYQNNGMSLHDTKSSVWKKWKDEIARVIVPGGICISFGWSSGGLGKERGFEVLQILLVPHGGNHNDTICVVESKKAPLRAREVQQGKKKIPVVDRGAPDKYTSVSREEWERMQRGDPHG